MQSTNNKSAKVSIMPLKSSQKKDSLLYDMDKTKDFNEIMRSIQINMDLPNEDIFSIKLVGRKKANLTEYIDETNYVETVMDGDQLEVVYSIPYIVNQIFGSINSESFKMLYEYSFQDVFINHLVYKNKHVDLMKMFIENDSLNNFQIEACLLNFAHLLKNEHIKNTEYDFVNKVLKIANNNEGRSAENGSNGNSLETESNHSVIKYALMVLRNILMSRVEDLMKWKRRILEELDVISLLTEYIGNEKYETVKFMALRMINTLLKCQKEKTKIKTINELIEPKFKKLIYDRIITKPMEKGVPYDLYMYQTYLLSHYKIDFSTTRKVDNDLILKFNVNLYDQINRSSFISNYDFDFENGFETENIDEKMDVNDSVEYKKRLRMSLASILSDSSRNSSSCLSEIYRPNSFDFDDLDISLLTINCMAHYLHVHPKSYNQTLVEEKFYKPGIFATSQCIIKILCRLLFIGHPPSKNYEVYQPLFFSENNLIYDLFSRTMWLLSKTRREMKASTISDFDKVINVVREQVRLILEEKHTNLADLTAAFTNSSFDAVLKYWSKKGEERMNHLLNKHECIAEMKQKIQKQNQPFVMNRRFSFMHRKVEMYKMTSDKKPFKMVNVLIHLSSNNKTVNVLELPKGKETGVPIKFSIGEISSIANGKNCEQWTESSNNPLRALNIILKDNTEKIQLLAITDKDSCYWYEGLAMLTGKTNNYTHYYDDELNELTEMDLRLQLIELQNVTIPKRPPKVPAPPMTWKPVIPPKPTKKHSFNVI